MELLERAGEAGEDTPFCDTLMASGAGDLVTRVTCVTCDMCDAGERTECTHDLRAVGSCNMVQYSSPLPDIYQNFAGSPCPVKYCEYS